MPNLPPVNNAPRRLQPTVALARDNWKHDRRMYGSRFPARIPDIHALSTDEARRRSCSAQARVSVYRQVGFGAAAALLSARGFAALHMTTLSTCRVNRRR